ncbi:CcoQ/FixQ family Cbb3-type cytochrome c oxidase assembly chaperone [Psychrosphaera ytuae]|uniref:CcoQ/FixQ family Cbb3-type cytochrome c oxidase assembly chaperone n=1 Tax=Psychrosphaera ytuae TaxID=2820710 RepID=A0A975DCK2_9GAMM|nr:CcoQ/FixQ family Cbb3-type cytochrome c oxidase assembly chaperone [Psychrosphaera ytuae]QTH64254.1 CcoQ/FixQ family Cbb3-type cytochrome c oxidase assembly chaperone [Psychrosphaera ytuae]
MDYGTYRGIYTLILLILFLGIVYWAYKKSSKKDFDKIAESILDDEDVNGTPHKKESSNGND